LPSAAKANVSSWSSPPPTPAGNGGGGWCVGGHMDHSYKKLRRNSTKIFLTLWKRFPTKKIVNLFQASEISIFW
jgi:hypothetical protein